MWMQIFSVGYPVFFVSLYELEDCPTCEVDNVQYTTRTEIAKAAVRQPAIVLNFKNTNDYMLVKMKFDGEPGFSFSNNRADLSGFGGLNASAILARLRSKGAK